MSRKRNDKSEALPSVSHGKNLTRAGVPHDSPVSKKKRTTRTANNAVLSENVTGGTCVAWMSRSSSVYLPWVLVYLFVASERGCDVS